MQKCQGKIILIMEKQIFNDSLAHLGESDVLNNETGELSNHYMNGMMSNFGFFGMNFFGFTFMILFWILIIVLIIAIIKYIKNN